MDNENTSEVDGRRLTAFCGDTIIGVGDAATVQRRVRAALAEVPTAPCRVFDDATGAQLDLDGDGELPAPPAPAPTVGRPRLGVVAREVTLLPRHWDWLSRQPGGASVALRRLVDEARRVRHGEDAVRGARERAYRFMLAMAGDLPGYESALRALFAGNRQAFDEAVLAWPVDVRRHAGQLAAGSWTQAQSGPVPGPVPGQVPDRRPD